MVISKGETACLKTDPFGFIFLIGIGHVKG